MPMPRTPERVPRSTRPDLNARIAAQTEESVRWHATHPGAIVERLDALDREWDVERTLEANAATLSVVGVLLGWAVDRRFFAVPGLVGAFLLQHALQGWCPPVPLIRRLGFRTQREIDEERYALKALRGDFAELKAGPKGAGWGAGQPPSARDRARLAFAAANARSL